MFDCHLLTDAELTDRLKTLAGQERGTGAALVAHLAEFEKRRLHEDSGEPNLFIYCTRVLRLSEAAAYKKIRAVEAARRYPEVIEMLSDGRIHLESLASLSPCIDMENYSALLLEACGKSTREVAVLAARSSGRPEKADSVKHYSAPSAKVDLPSPPSLFDPIAPPSSAIPSPESTAVSEPRVRFSFTGSEALLLKIEKAKGLLRHKHPDGRLEDIFDDALELFLERKDPDRRIKRSAALERHTRATLDPRHIPQAVKDEVWQRDGGRCAFLRPDGSRCEQSGGLEFDHIVPFALGGPSSNAKNIRLLCRAHNQIRGRQTFGGPRAPSGR